MKRLRCGPNRWWLVVVAAAMAFAIGCDRRPARWHAALADEMRDMAHHRPEPILIALAEYEKLITDYPDAPDLEAAYYYRALVYHRLEEWRRCTHPEARRVAETVQPPVTNAVVHAAYNELFARFPDSPYQYLVRPTSHLVRETPPGWLTVVEVISPGPTPDAETKSFLDIIWAYELHETSQTQNLATEFLAAYPESPHRARVAYLLARSYHQTLDYPKAAPAYRAVIEQFPGTDEVKRAKNQLAWALYARLGRLDEGQALYREMLTEHRDHPTYGWALVNLGECALIAGDTDSAMGWFEQAALLDDDYYLWDGQRAREYATSKLPPPPRRGYLVESGAVK